MSNKFYLDVISLLCKCLLDASQFISYFLLKIAKSYGGAKKYRKLSYPPPWNEKGFAELELYDFGEQWMAPPSLHAK